MAEVNAVLFAKDHRKVAKFYREALGFSFSSGDQSHSILNCRGFELVVHQIPQQFPDEGSLDETPIRREAGSLRLEFPVRSIDQARSVAATLGGIVDDSPPAWAGKKAKFFLGHDPEGNVFGLHESG